MRVFRGHLRPVSEPVALAIGNFDGVHLGHVALLRRLGEAARRLGVASTVLTFEPHPREFFAPALAPARLSTFREKIELLAEQGTPDTVAQLHGYPLIGPDRNLLEIEFLRERGFDCSAPHAVIRTDDHLAQLAALRAGLGIGVCSRQVAQRHGLVRVLQGQVDFNVDVWIAMHQDMRKVQRIAVVFDALGGALADFLQPR